MTWFSLISADWRHLEAIRAAVEPLGVWAKGALGQWTRRVDRPDYELNWAYASEEPAILHGAAALWRATKDDALFGAWKQRVDWMLEDRGDRRGMTDEVRGKIVAGWPVLHYSLAPWCNPARPEFGKRMCSSVHIGNQAKAIAELALACTAKKLTSDAAKYRQEAIEVLGVIEELWNGQHYVESMILPNETTYPWNCSALPATAWLLLGQKAKAKAVLTGWYKSWYTSSKTGLCAWPYWVGRTPPDDTGHAAETISLMAEGIACGVGIAAKTSAIASLSQRMLSVPGQVGADVECSSLTPLQTSTIAAWGRLCPWSKAMTFALGDALISVGGKFTQSTWNIQAAGYLSEALA